MANLFTIDTSFKITKRLEDEIERVIDEGISLVPYKSGRMADSIYWEFDEYSVDFMIDESLCDYWSYVDEKTGWVGEFQDFLEDGISGLTPDTNTDKGFKFDMKDYLKELLKGFDNLVKKNNKKK